MSECVSFTVNKIRKGIPLNEIGLNKILSGVLYSALRLREASL
jgi:hypothetical protein